MQAKPTRPCTAREHLESVDEPGHCVWCDAPLRCIACSQTGGHLADCDRNVAVQFEEATSLTDLINRFDAGEVTAYRAIAMAYDLGSKAVLQLQQGGKR